MDEQKKTQQYHINSSSFSTVGSHQPDGSAADDDDDGDDAKIGGNTASQSWRLSLSVTAHDLRLCGMQPR